MPASIPASVPASARAMRRPRRRVRRTDVPLAGVGSLVTERRLTLGLTQAELADLADVGVSSVRTIEAGQVSVTLAVAIRVLDALGLALAVGPRHELIGVRHAAIVEPARTGDG